jgi:3-dehydroquinate synthase
MKKILVTTADKDYNIYIERDFASLARYMRQFAGLRICVVTDDVVNALYAYDIEKALRPFAADVCRFVFPAGESSKTLDTISEMYKCFLANRLDRSSVIVALGGGVCGDMAGFAAATYMRGVRFVQVPTTLLAQVDSSVGGKTGVDFSGHKNIIGAFYQPEFVYVNISALLTLPSPQFSSGMGEAIKHGLIADESYYRFTSENRAAIKSQDKDALEKLVARSCEIKAEVVSKDEKETGLRAILNFGHTIGHAIEALKDYTLFHGHCVAVGCVAALYLSLKMGNIKQEDVTEVSGLFKFFELPVSFSGIDAEGVFDQATYDKKAKNGAVNMILLEKIGQARIYEKAAKEDIIYAISAVKEHK